MDITRALPLADILVKYGFELRRRCPKYWRKKKFYQHTVTLRISRENSIFFSTKKSNTSASHFFLWLDWQTGGEGTPGGSPPSLPDMWHYFTRCRALRVLTMGILKLTYLEKRGSKLIMYKNVAHFANSLKSI